MHRTRWFKSKTKRSVDNFYQCEETIDKTEVTNLDTIRYDPWKRFFACNHYQVGTNESIRSLGPDSMYGCRVTFGSVELEYDDNR